MHRRRNRGKKRFSKVASFSTGPSDPEASVGHACPITLEPIVDPVCVATGTVFERSALEAWFVHVQSMGFPLVDPATGITLPRAQCWAVPRELLEDHSRAGSVEGLLRRHLQKVVVAADVA